MKTDNSQKIKTLWVLCSVPFIMVLGNSMLIPVLPQIRTALNVSLFEVGLLITTFSGAAGISILFAGYLADRFGRKVVIVPALAVYGIGGIAAGFASIYAGHSYPYILGARVIQGIGAGGTYQIAMVLVSDLFSGGDRSHSLGLLESYNGAGKVISPLAGAGTALIAWFAPFFFYGVLAIPIAAAVYFFAQEPNIEKQHSSVKQYISDLVGILGTKKISFALALLCGFTVLFLLFGVLSYASDIMEAQYNIGDLKRGMLIAIPVLAMAVTSYITGSVVGSNKMSKMLKIVVAAGSALFAIALFVSAALKAPIPSLVTTVFMGIGTGMTLPALNTLITSSSPSDTRGLTTAFYGTVRFAGVAFGPPAFGLLATGGRPLTLVVGAGLAAVVALLTAFGLNTSQMIPEQMQAAE